MTDCSAELAAYEAANAAADTAEAQAQVLRAAAIVLYWVWYACENGGMSIVSPLLQLATESHEQAKADCKEVEHLAKAGEAEKVRTLSNRMKTRNDALEAFGATCR